MQKHEIKRLLSIRKDREYELLEQVVVSNFPKDRVIMVLVLQALHHLYPDGISSWFGSKQRICRHPKRVKG
jgi:hypothetical protein